MVNDWKRQKGNDKTDHEVILSGSVTLDCKVSGGVPIPQIKWYKFGEPLRPNLKLGYSHTCSRNRPIKVGKWPLKVTDKLLKSMAIIGKVADDRPEKIAINLQAQNMFSATTATLRNQRPFWHRPISNLSQKIPIAINFHFSKFKIFQNRRFFKDYFQKQSVLPVFDISENLTFLTIFRSSDFRQFWNEQFYFKLTILVNFEIDDF